MTEISPAQYQRLRKVLVTMPYSNPLASPSDKLYADAARTQLDVDYLTEWLEELSEVIALAAKKANDVENELYELTTQRDAIRAFLGVQ